MLEVEGNGRMRGGHTVAVGKRGLNHAQEGTCRAPADALCGLHSSRGRARAFGASDMCHTPTLQTGASPVGPLSNVNAKLYSDLLLHVIGAGSGRRNQPGRRVRAVNTAPHTQVMLYLPAQPATLGTHGSGSIQDLLHQHDVHPLAVEPSLLVVGAHDLESAASIQAHAGEFVGNAASTSL